MKKNYSIFIIIFIFILLWIFLFYTMKKKYIESFTTSDNEYAKNVIVNNCNLTWGKMNSSQGDVCGESTWLTNPSLLCGICGGTPKSLLYSLTKNGKTFYGCSTNASNPYQLAWDSLNNSTSKLSSTLGNILTCNSYNSSAISDMMLFICFDDYCSVYINGKVVTNQTGWNTEGIYHYTNLKYGDDIKIVGTNTCSPGGLALSYIWNKQLFILDNNGFEHSANIINYTVTGSTGWDNSTWASSMPTIAPWMKNFITCAYCSSCSNCKTTLTIEFKVGYTKNTQLNSDVNMFLGIDDSGIALKNGFQVYNKNQSWNNTVNFVIPNVNEGDVISINAYNVGGPGGVGVLYLWYGFVFSFPQNNIAGFNNCVNLINLTGSSNNTVNTYNYTYHQNGPGYFNLMPNWLYTNNSVGNFGIQFKATFSTLVFQLSGGYQTVPQKDDTNQIIITNTNGVTMYNDPVRGSVFNFSGSNYLTVSVITSVNFTRSAWAYYNKTTPVSSNIYSSNNCPLWYPGGYNINACINFQSGGPTIKDNQNRVNKWTHYAVTYNSGSKIFSLYVNGALLSSVTLNSSTFWNGDVGTHWIGGYQGGNNWYGYISNIEEYNVTFTAQQITDLYNSQLK